ncbi:AbiJ-NTD4 domain-containing protein [Pedobacter sp. R20-19]|uniref:AbiJ-NTD4 domain-containing protein n=1 Tax=Pedobacter sp. R20-19 TaxID=1270196 RepID=UPI0004931F80|nr:hypothetical protein [Pedobacter sp. R20-19]
MRFSQRIGKTSIRELIQVESIDEKLTNRIWNIIIEYFFNSFSQYGEYNSVSPREKICIYIWKEYFGNRTDEAPSPSYNSTYSESVIGYVKKYYLKAKWFEKYDLIEFLSEIEKQDFGFTKMCNEALTTEMSAYRIINHKIVQITSEQEILSIENALSNSEKWNSVNIHLETAINILANRENPDYRNSIKESISSVESLCAIITNDNKATLGKALAKIEKMHNLHQTLKSAFTLLYGYTSDSGGIRHALSENDTPVTFEDAKFMLVSCSAFINYLKVKIEK